MLRNFVGFLLASTVVVPATAGSPGEDAKLFGARESTAAMDISPDGKRVVYIGPGPDRISVVVVADLAGGAARPILRSTGKPEKLSWCKFASNDRLTCRFRSIINDGGILVPVLAADFGQS